MEISERKQKEYIRRLMLARMTILTRNGFFGLLLMHMKFALDDKIETAATDGARIYFDPIFLDSISDSELVFILMHEIMHIVLKHTLREGDRENLRFNIACDIVVNSNILEAAEMDPKSITLEKYGESMHLAPDGIEGFIYTAEEVYEMLSSSEGSSCSITKGKNRPGERSSRSDSSAEAGTSGVAGGFSDDHSKWGSITEEAFDALWDNRIRNAYEASKARNSGKGTGNIPKGIERAIKKMFESKTDWRVLLNDFVQEEVVDYSFMPPDRRFSDSPFMLPDFNEEEVVVKNILFMIDTSGSMTDDDIAQAYFEIKGAIDQFNGNLEGWLGFFDAKVVPPTRFVDENEFKVIRPEGGGGTSFKAVFKYIRDEMGNEEIANIIILTDGYAPFPEESAALGIPVLWMINNDEVKPPWGKVAVI